MICVRKKSFTFWHCPKVVGRGLHMPKVVGPFHKVKVSTNWYHYLSSLSSKFQSLLSYLSTFYSKELDVGRDPIQKTGHKRGHFWASSFFRQNLTKKTILTDILHIMNGSFLGLVKKIVHLKCIQVYPPNPPPARATYPHNAHHPSSQHYIPQRCRSVQMDCTFKYLLPRAAIKM